MAPSAVGPSAPVCDSRERLRPVPSQRFAECLQSGQRDVVGLEIERDYGGRVERCDCDCGGAGVVERVVRQAHDPEVGIVPERLTKCIHSDGDRRVRYTHPATAAGAGATHGSGG
eukprot:scaffold19948_cov90-Isochrysis_galbana.AAC.2